MYISITIDISWISNFPRANNYITHPQYSSINMDTHEVGMGFNTWYVEFGFTLLKNKFMTNPNMDFLYRIQVFGVY